MDKFYQAFCQKSVFKPFLATFLLLFVAKFYEIYKLFDYGLFSGFFISFFNILLFNFIVFNLLFWVFKSHFLKAVWLYFAIVLPLCLVSLFLSFRFQSPLSVIFFELVFQSNFKEILEFISVFFDFKIFAIFSAIFALCFACFRLNFKLSWGGGLQGVKNT
ncbi:hypothetical protein [Campylobacter gastrosuis]|uniref:Sulfatase n=1 Tax=Campylobacter gastrosuis TaxID=2974576 RepID=A0ABT7HRE9_9BACT|nr:hypothetical protein [Campylobacter gastrosuis]MDL0088969.1 hypothetical protein [Campylobacter gastrosuis]